MKTFKIFYASFAFLFLGLVPMSAMGQSLPHTFTANTPSVASEVNANFKYLLDRFGGIRETTVNCSTSGGSGINSAIQNGYNSIVINGTCNENIKLVGIKGKTPRLLKLRGANNDASVDKIVDNSSYADNVITAWYSGMLLTIDNLTISGGDRGITTWSNINLKIYNSKVEGYKEGGIHLAGSSVMDADNLTIDGSYNSASSSETGLELWGSSMAYGNNLTITNNQKYGITTWISDIQLDGNITLTGNAKAINVGHNASLSSSATIAISHTTDHEAISVYQGLIHLHDGAITVTNFANSSLNAWMSNVFIRNFTATGDGSSSRNVIDINNSVGALENVTLSNGGQHGIGLHQSDVEIDNLTSSNNKDLGIGAYRSRVDMRNSVISGNEGDGIEIDQGSSFAVRSSTISSNSDEGIEVEGNSFIKIRDSTTISNNDDSAIKIDEGSVLDVKDSTITGKTGQHAIAGFNKSIMILNEDSGTTLIQTTNADAILLINSHGEVREGVTVTSNTKGIHLDMESTIKIDKNATVNGSDSAGSITGSMRSTIEIDNDATISSPVFCGLAQTMVIVEDNSSNVTTGYSCIRINRN